MSRITIILLLSATILSACTTPPVATQVNISQVQTDAVATYQAGLPVIPPVDLPMLIPTAGNTSTPIPPTPTVTSTLQPTSTQIIPSTSSDGIQYFAGDHAAYSSQIPADWPVLHPTQHIVVSWTLLNNGSTTWDSGYTVQYVRGFKPWGITQVHLMSVVEPGETGSAAIDVFAPEATGNFITYWALFNPDGDKIFQVYFAFVVR
jgi:hypothetical protein